MGQVAFAKLTAHLPSFVAVGYKIISSRFQVSHKCCETEKHRAIVCYILSSLADLFPQFIINPATSFLILFALLVISVCYSSKFGTFSYHIFTDFHTKCSLLTEKILGLK